MSETDFFLDILHSKIDYVLELMIFLANLSGFSNSKSFLKVNSLCGQIEYCNSSLYDVLKFKKKSLKYYQDTLCKKNGHKLIKPIS